MEKVKAIINSRIKEYDAFILEAQNSTTIVGDDKKNWLWGLENSKDELLYLLDLIQ